MTNDEIAKEQIANADLTEVNQQLLITRLDLSDNIRRGNDHLARINAKFVVRWELRKRELMPVETRLTF